VVAHRRCAGGRDARPGAIDRAGILGTGPAGRAPPSDPRLQSKRAQSARLATELGRRTGLPVQTELLVRRRETRTQTALTPEARQANVAGAFEARRAAGCSCVLVDDVFTTGATLAEAGAALRLGGAAKVEAVTFARAEPPVALS